MITLLKWLPWLGKLSFASKILAFIPGGQVFAVIGGIIGWIGQAFAWFVTWLFADIADGFKQPQRVVVRFACFAVVLAVGVWFGIRHDGDKVEQARGETRALQTLWNERDQDDARKARDAKAQREAAERMEQERAAEEQRKREQDAAARPAAAGGLRPVTKRPAAKAEPSMFGGFPSLSGWLK